MGLIKKDYIIPGLGIPLDQAYAQVVMVSSENEGNTISIVQVKRKREDFENKELQPFQTVAVPFTANKDVPLWEQAYQHAKETYFSDWEDDLV